MLLTHVRVDAFRCIRAAEFPPAPGVNVVRGANAQGKTSLLEAILFAATSKSHRTNNERELLRHGAEAFGVRLEAQRSDRPVTVEARWWQGAKRVKVNDIAQTRLSDVLGKVHVVFFCPEDIELVKGSAAARRRFADMELAQLSPAYLNALQQYREALRQRNELLRRPRPDAALLEVYETQLAPHGATLMRERAGFIEELAAHAAAAYAGIAAGEGFGLRYVPSVETAENLAGALADARERDLRRGVTTLGPHRDDIALEIAGKPARTFGSQGQQKSAALAIKLAELELVQARTGEYPVLLLDEVLAELDGGRARQLFTTLPDAVQCIATTTELEATPGRFGTATTDFEIAHGRLTRR